MRDRRMKIQVLGAGCAKCDKLYAEAVKAVAQAGLSAELEKVQKIEEIIKFGVALTPALVVNGEVKSAGKVPNAAEIASWLKETR